MLLPDKGGGLPKHVGGTIVCKYLICCLCASSWYSNNTKHNICMLS